MLVIRVRVLSGAQLRAFWTWLSTFVTAVVTSQRFTFKCVMNKTLSLHIPKYHHKLSLSQQISFRSFCCLSWRMFPTKHCRILSGSKQWPMSHQQLLLVTETRLLHLHNVSKASVKFSNYSPCTCLSGCRTYRAENFSKFKETWMTENAELWLTFSSIKTHQILFRLLLWIIRLIVSILSLSFDIERLPFRCLSSQREIWPLSKPSNHS